MYQEKPIEDAILAHGESSATWAQAYATLRVATALETVANALYRLGTNDAATHMGALEYVAMELRDGFRALSSAVEELKP